MTTTLTTHDASSSAYFDTPPAYDLIDLSVTAQKELLSDTRSLSCSTTSAPTLAAVSFNPGKTLLVHAQGIRLFRLPLPDFALQTPITDVNGEVEYVSTRAKTCSGNAVLKDAMGKERLASEYFFGPGREAKIHVLSLASGSHGGGDDEAAARVIETKGRWTSRQLEFVMPDGGRFAWRYRKERDTFASEKKGKEKRKRHLVLEVYETSSSSSSAAGSAEDKKKSDREEGGRRIAELVRNEQARTPGSSSTRAGNGGELRIDADYCETIGFREDVIVASCLMMLKKEVDRRRAVQFAIMAGAASGGS